MGNVSYLTLGAKLNENSLDVILKNFIDFKKKAEKSAEINLKAKADPGLNKEIMSVLGDASNLYNKKFSKLNLTSKFTESLGTALDESLPSEQRLASIEGVLSYLHSLERVQSKLGSKTDLSLLQENDFDRLIKLQEKADAAQSRLSQSIESNKEKIKDITFDNRIPNRKEAIQAANEIGIAQDIGKNVDLMKEQLKIGDDAEISRNGRQLLSQYTKIAGLYKTLTSEFSAIGKQDLGVAKNAEQYAIKGRQRLDTYRYIQDIENDIVKEFGEGIQRNLLSKTGAVPKDETNVRGKYFEAQKIYAEAASSRQRASFNAAEQAFQDAVVKSYTQRLDKQTIAGEKAIEKAASKSSTLKEEGTKLAMSAAGIDDKALKQYNLTLDECIAKVKELDALIMSDNFDSKPEAEQSKLYEDQAIYSKRARDLAKKQGENIIDLYGNEEMFDENYFQGLEKNLGKRGRVIIDALNKQTSDASKTISSTMESAVPNQTDIVKTQEQISNTPLPTVDNSGIEKYNLSLDECIAKVQELYTVTEKESFYEMPFSYQDKINEDLAIYASRAEELAKTKGIDVKSLYDKSFQFDDETLDMFKENLTDRGQQILEGLRTSTESLKSNVEKSQEIIATGQKEIQDKSKEIVNQNKTIEKPLSEVKKNEEKKQEVVSTTTKPTNEKVVSDSGLPGSSKDVKITVPIDDAINNIKTLESALEDVTKSRNININGATLDDVLQKVLETQSALDELSKSKNINVGANNIEDAPYLSDDHGNIINAYRGVSGTHGGLFSSDNGYTFFTSSKENGISYGKNGKLYSANLKMKNPLEIDAKGAEWDNIKFLGDPLSNDSVAQEIQLANSTIANMTDNIRILEGELSKSPGEPVMFNGINLSAEQANAKIEEYRGTLQDAQATFDRISKDESNPYGITSTDDIARWARSTGLYDGVVFRNIVDYLDTEDISNRALTPSDVYTVFDQKQIKNARVAGSVDKNGVLTEIDHVKQNQKTDLIGQNKPEIKSDTSNVDISPEIASMNTLRDAVSSVTEAVNAKTAAFENEASVVSGLLNGEGAAMDGLRGKVDGVTESVKEAAETAKSQKKEATTENKEPDKIINATSQDLKRYGTAVTDMLYGREINMAQSDAYNLIKKNVGDATKRLADEGDLASSDKMFLKKWDEKNNSIFDSITRKEAKDFNTFSNFDYSGIDGYEEKLQELRTNLDALTNYKNIDFDFINSDDVSDIQSIISQIQNAKDSLKTMQTEAAKTARAEQQAALRENAKYERETTKLVEQRQRQELSMYKSGFLAQLQNKSLTSQQDDMLKKLPTYYKDAGVIYQQELKNAANEAKTQYVQREFADLSKLEIDPSRRLDEYTTKLNQLRSILEEINGMTIDPNDEKEKDDLIQMTNDARTLKAELQSGNFTAAAPGELASMQERWAKIKAGNRKAFNSFQFRDQFNQMDQAVANARSITDVRNVNAEISTLTANFTAAGKAGASFGQTIKQRVGSLGAYLASFASFYRIWGVFKQGVQTITELDTALTEMRKVSDESLESLQNYQKTTFDMADSVGSTALTIQNSTADWMRLGESMDEASKSAEVSSVLMNVSEFQSIDEATESLVAMSAAYDDLDKIEIVDKLNQVGNNFAISTDGLATALQNSAAALKVSGNSIDESIALITASNTVLQDPSRVGNAMRTIALRMTGTEEAKKELEEAGDDVSDYVVQTQSKIDEQVRNYTAVASNKYKGVSLLDDNGNYRSTYEVLQDIADVYDEISASDKELGNNRLQALTELLAGKARANALAAILQNGDILRESYQQSQGAEGSAMEENEKYLDSIEGKMAQMKNRLQEFTTLALDSDAFKGLIDGATAFLETLNNIVKTAGLLPTLFGAGAAFSMAKNIPNYALQGKTLLSQAANDKALAERFGMSIPNMTMLNRAQARDTFADILKNNPSKFRTYDDVAAFAAGKGISLQDTQSAVDQAGWSAAATESGVIATNMETAAAATTEASGAAATLAAEDGTVATEAATVTGETAALTAEEAAVVMAVGEQAGAEAEFLAEQSLAIGGAGEMAVATTQVAASTEVAAGAAANLAEAYGVAAANAELTGVAATANVGKFEAAGQGILTSLKNLFANPVVITLAATAAVTGGIIAYRNHQEKEFDRKYEGFQEDNEKRIEAEKQFEDYNTQLQEVDDKIASINAKGKLSLTDTTDLANLQAEREELERLRDSYDAIAKREGEAASKKAVKAFKVDNAVNDLTTGRTVASSTTTKSTHYKRTDLLTAQEHELAEYENLQKKKEDIEKDLQLNPEDLVKQKELEDVEGQIEKYADTLNSQYDKIKELKESLDTSGDDPEAVKLFERAQKIMDDTNYKMSESKTPMDQMKKNFDRLFKGTGEDAAKYGKGVQDYITNAVKNGEKATDVLRSLGITYDDLAITGDEQFTIEVDGIEKTISSAELLNKYFKDLAGSAREANNEIKNIKPAADGTFEGVKKAQESENAGANWESMSEWFSNAQELKKKKLVGTDDFQSVAQFMSPTKIDPNKGELAYSQYVKAFEANQKKFKRYFDKENPIDSVTNFIDDAISKGKMHKDSKTGIIEDDFKNTAELAKEMGISVEATEIALNHMKDYGFEFYGIDYSAEKLSDFKDGLDQLQTQYDEMTESSPEKDRLGRILQGFNSEYQIFEDDMSKLDDEAIINIKFEYDLSSILQEIQSLSGELKFSWDNAKGATYLADLENAVQKMEEKTGVKSSEYTKDYLSDVLQDISETTDPGEIAELQQKYAAIMNMQKDFQQSLLNGETIDWQSFVSDNLDNVLSSMNLGEELQNEIRASLLGTGGKGSSKPQTSDYVSPILHGDSVESQRRYYNNHKDEMTEAEKSNYRRQWTEGAGKESGENINGNLVDNVEESNKRVVDAYLDRLAKGKDVEKQEKKMSEAAEKQGKTLDDLVKKYGKGNKNLDAYNKKQKEAEKSTKKTGKAQEESGKKGKPEKPTTPKPTTPKSKESGKSQSTKPKYDTSSITQFVSDSMTSKTAQDVVVNFVAEDEATPIIDAWNSMEADDKFTELTAKDQATVVLTLWNAASADPKFTQLSAEDQATYIVNLWNGMSPEQKEAVISGDNSAAMNAISQVNSANVNGKTVNISASGNALSTINTVKAEMRSLHNKTVTLTTKKVTEKITKTKHVGGNGGRASEESHGTITAFASGTRKVGTLPLSSAFIKNNSIRSDENAIINEVGKEGLVRNGNLYTVNNGKPIITRLKKDDVILNHQQMKELHGHAKGIVRDDYLTETYDSPKYGDIVFSEDQMRELEENGRISSYGRIVGGPSAFASGTLFDEDERDEDAYSIGTIKAHRGPDLTSSKDNNKGGTNTKQNDTGGGKTKKGKKKKKKNSKSDKKSKTAAEKLSAYLEKLFDWVEIRLLRLNRITENAKKAADNANNLGSALKNLNSAISGTKKEITATTKGAKVYKAQADKVAKKAQKVANKDKKVKWGKNTAKKLNKKIQNGTLKIEDYSEYTRTYIKAYQEWYEKYLNALDKLADLEQQKTELYQEKLDKIVDRYDAIISKYDASASRTESYLDLIKTQGESRNATYYDSAVSSRKKDLNNIATNALTEYNKYRAEYNQQVKDKVLTGQRKDEAYTQLKNLEAAYYDAKKAAVEFQQELDELDFSYLEMALDVLQKGIDRLKDSLDFAENYGNRKNTPYTRDEKSYKNIISGYQDSLNAAYKMFNDALENMDKYEKNPDGPWNDWLEKAEQARGTIMEISNSIVETGEGMRELRWKPWEDGIKKLERVSDNLETIQGLLNEDNFLDKKGFFTSEGLANLVLFAERIRENNAQVENYRQSLDKLQEDYDHNNISLDELTERSGEYMDAIKQLAEQTDDYRQNILDEYLKSIEKQNELLEENIEKRRDALSKMKDYYDYEKSIRDKSRDINYLQQQIAALDGVSNKAAQAKLASLRNQLQEAQQDFRDTKRDHELDLRSEGYDKLSQDVNEAFEKMTDDIKRSTELQNQIIDNMLSNMTDGYGEAYNTINEVIRQHGLVFDDMTNDVLNDIKTTSQELNKIAALYGDVEDTKTAFQKELEATQIIDISTAQILFDSIIKGTNAALNKALNEELGKHFNADVKEEVPVAGSDLKSGVSGGQNNGSKNTNTLSEAEKRKRQQQIEQELKLQEEARAKAEAEAAKMQKSVGIVTGTKGGTKTAVGVVSNVATSVVGSSKSSTSSSKNKTLKSDATTFINKNKQKAKKKKSEYSDVNQKIYSKTGGYVLSSDNLKKLAKKVGVTYDNAKKTGKLYKKLDSIGYFARGSQYITKDMLGWTQDKGQELVFKRADGTILTPLGKGDKVFTAQMTDNLWQLAKMNQDGIAKNVTQNTTVNNKPNITLNFDSFMHVEGNVDENAVQDLRKFKDEIIRDFTKQLTNDFGMYGHKLRF